jgi:hypothetical protein
MTCVPRLQDSAKKAKHKAASGDNAKKRTHDSEKHSDKKKDSKPITPDDQNAETKVDLSFTHSRPRP